MGQRRVCVLIYEMQHDVRRQGSQTQKRARIRQNKELAGRMSKKMSPRAAEEGKKCLGPTLTAISGFLLMMRAAQSHQADRVLETHDVRGRALMTSRKRSYFRPHPMFVANMSSKNPLPYP